MAKEKTIFRTKLTSKFVRIQNDILTNPNLSWKAKGLLCFMLSRKDDWKFHKVQVEKYSKDGRDGTISAFNELIKAGYVKQIRKRDEKGKFASFDYYVYDTPFTGNPQMDNPKMDKPFTGNPYSENPHLVTTQGATTDLVTTEFSKIDFNKDVSSIPGSSYSSPAETFNKNLTFEEMWEKGIYVDPKEFLTQK